MSTSTKNANALASVISSTKIPIRDVRAIVQERVSVTRTQLCDEFHVILKRIETMTNTFSHEIHVADVQGQTVSYGQLYATLNRFQAVVVAGKEQIEKLRTPLT